MTNLTNLRRPLSGPTVPELDLERIARWLSPRSAGRKAGGFTSSCCRVTLRCVSSTRSSSQK